MVHWVQSHPEVQAILSRRPSLRQQFRLHRFLQQAAQRDPRTERRLPCQRPIHFRLDRGPFYQARLQDVSAEGLGALLPFAPRQRSRLQILYRLDQDASYHWVEGEVRWSREQRARYLTGVELEFHCDQEERSYRALLERALPEALAEDWFEVFLQPVSA